MPPLHVVQHEISALKDQVLGALVGVNGAMAIETASVIRGERGRAVEGDRVVGPGIGWELAGSRGGDRRSPQLKHMYCHKGANSGSPLAVFGVTASITLLRCTMFAAPSFVAGAALDVRWWLPQLPTSKVVRRSSGCA